MLTSGAVLPDIDYIELQMKNTTSDDLQLYTTNPTIASQNDLYDYSFDIKIYNGRPIEITKSEGKININLPTANDLPSELAYNTRGNDTGIDSVLKIYFKSSK